MNGYISLICVSVLVTGGITNAQQITSIEISDDVVPQGGNTTIKCVVGGYTPGSLVYWWKRQGDDVTQIGTNTLINDSFFNTGRYTSVGEVDKSNPSAALVSLTITGVEAEDSGDIGCGIPRSNQVVKYVTLHVVVPMEEMHLYSIDEEGNVLQEYENNSIIPFNEGEEHHFMCTAFGSNPAPTMTVTLADEDVSEYFSIESTSEVTGGMTGLRQIHYSATARTTSAIHVASYANARTFRCTVHVPHVDDNSVGIVPNLKFSPTIKCPSKVVSAVGDVNVDITCKAKANPFLTYQRVHTHRKDDSIITLEEGQRYLHYKFFVEDGTTVDEKILRLHIERIHHQDFREFSFLARNELGDVTATVQFQRDPKDTDESSGHMMKAWGLSILLCSIVALFFRV